MIPNDIWWKQMKASESEWDLSEIQWKLRLWVSLGDRQWYLVRTSGIWMNMGEYKWAYMIAADTSLPELSQDQTVPGLVQAWISISGHSCRANVNQVPNLVTLWYSYSDFDHACLFEIMHVHSISSKFHPFSLGITGGHPNSLKVSNFTGPHSDLTRFHWLSFVFIKYHWVSLLYTLPFVFTDFCPVRTVITDTIV